MNRDEKILADYVLPAPVGGGFSMEGYWVWCPSVIRDDSGLYHMFASRWKKDYPFHPGWGMASEVVRAVSNTPEGPYRFEEVVLPPRGAGYWDGRSTHNPSIQKCGDTYLLFYTGMTYPYPDLEEPEKLHHNSLEWLASRASKRIGIAVSKSLTGPWERPNKPTLDVRPGYFDDFFTSNPTPCVNPDGSCLLIYKTRTYRLPPYDTQEDMFSGMKLGVAYTDHYTKPFTRLCNKPLFAESDFTLEDPFLFKTSDGYAMIAKDWSGTCTGDVGSLAYASSRDGIHWEILKDRSSLGRNILWDDGVMRLMGNIDRPFLLFSENEATHFFAATNNGSEPGFQTMTKTWNACIPLSNSRVLLDKK